MAKVATAPPPINDLESWFAALARPTALTELAVIAACVVLAWCLVWLVRKAAGTPDEKSILFGHRLVDGVLFPLVLLSLAYASRGLVAQWMPVAVFRIVIPVLVALVAIRIGVKVLQAAKEMGMNISQTVDGLLAEEVKRRYWGKWRDDNRESMDAYNQRIAQEGLPLAKYRSFAGSLGDGQKG